MKIERSFLKLGRREKNILPNSEGSKYKYDFLKDNLLA